MDFAYITWDLLDGYICEVRLQVLAAIQVVGSLIQPKVCAIAMQCEQILSDVHSSHHTPLLLRSELVQCEASRV